MNMIIENSSSSASASQSEVLTRAPEQDQKTGTGINQAMVNPYQRKSDTQPSEEANA